MSESTITIGGRNAVLTLARVHPESIERLFFNKETAPLFKETCSYLASHRRVYRLVEDTELERLTKTTHHGGAAAVIPAPTVQEPTLDFAATWPDTEPLVLALDGLSNSHNLGAIVRTAAFLGINHLVVQKPGPKQDSLLTPTLWRVAEGGMEFVRLWFVRNLPKWLESLKAGPHGRRFHFVAADQNAPVPVQKFRSEASADRLPIVILGGEEKGLSAATHRLADRHVAIPGTRAVESLNVAHAAAILMWELARRGR